MVTDTSESRGSSAPAERRPAIWPWLVMPLATLTLFYGLYRMHEHSSHFRPAPDNAPAEIARP